MGGFYPEEIDQLTDGLSRIVANLYPRAVGAEG
jgi:hypothetical protein